MVAIAVLGGGPGGGATALALAWGGARVTLYRPARAGEKPCGGALPESLLPQIPGFDVDGLPAVRSPRAILESAEGGRIELVLHGIRIFRRGDLDPALVAAAIRAGARLVEGKVEELSVQGSQVRVRGGGESRWYDWVVAADGARSLGRRLLGLSPRGESVGLGATLHGLECSALVLSFPNTADAYLWIFPRPGGASVGIAYSPDRLSHGTARAQLEAFLDRHLPVPWQTLPGPRYRYPIPVFGPWSLEALRQGLENRLLLVGDGAALADPLTREGIRYAILSGLWAAEALLAGRPENYLNRVAEELASEMARAHRAREYFFEDPIGQWMVPVARIHPGVRKVLHDLLACRQSYQGLRRRLLRAAVKME